MDGQGGGLLLQPDGKILVTGNFTNLAGAMRRNVGRLNSDGTLDESFTSVNGITSCRAIQSDGKILVTGQFTNPGGSTINYFGRLWSDGTVDQSFDPRADHFVVGVAIQCDGKIIIGGGFTNVAGQLRKSLAQLNPDGTLDALFNANVERYDGPLTFVNSSVLQEDGKILVAGSFTNLAGQRRNSIGRLNSTGLVTQDLTLNGTTITWLRGGVGPEVYRTTFDFSTDGVNWTHLANGTRIVGGWQCTNISIPPNANVRARGFVSTRGSEWYVESMTRPTINVNDGSLGFYSNQFGFNIGGNVGQVLVVETSTNAMDWTPIKTNVVGTGPVYFTDPDSTNFTSRLYRTRTQ
jgi:uncharacterized delta-60 repeat protein